MTSSTTTLLNGNVLAKELKAKIKIQAAELKEKNIVPHLAAILVGNDGASETYVASKVKDCAEVGFKSTLIRFESDVTEKELLDSIKKLNSDDGVHGILVQLPLPKHLSVQAVTECISPEKDVDGFHPINIGRMNKNLPCHLPATPYGIMLMLQNYGIDTKGKHCVVLGRSHIVGSPMSILLARNTEPGNCTVTLCHSYTQNITDICLQADIIVAALGIPNYLKANMVKPGAVVIDVGITRIADESKAKGYYLCGDVAYEEVAPKCSYITPVPGGVGPMTRLALLQNTLQAAENTFSA